MSNPIRVLILADSLGCPRSEISVEKTWVDRFMMNYRNDDCVFYTYCEHGLHSNNINRGKIQQLHPDLIICQIGIVDACRRAVKQRTLSLIKHIPLFRERIKNYLSKNHYRLTKRKAIHYASVSDYVDLFSFLSSIADVLALPISKPGQDLINKVYNVSADVDTYNGALLECRSDTLSIIDPYNTLVADEYLLSDGHHLNECGQEIVLNKVCTEFDKWLEKRKSE